MTMTWLRAALLAALIFLALFAIRFATSDLRMGGASWDQVMQQAVDVFEIGRRNYASSKKGGLVAPVPPGGAPFPGPGSESQKYEKIGSLTQVTYDYDADRTKIESEIKSASGLVQLERATGLKDQRVLQLGVGVPPEKFDAFIETIRGIGKNAAIEIVKNDKTNEYLQLRAKRATLEKARTALEELRAGGGSTDERINVQTRLTDIEQQIQDLGVSLGEFDSQNELCTVKLTLQEWVKPKPLSMTRRAFRAFEQAVSDYVMLGLGFFAISFALMMGVWGLRESWKLWARYNTP
jgi:uncharacterized protein YfcZ (UPF0381/DUF406 family)